jgi:hypothetical protein
LYRSFLSFTESFFLRYQHHCAAREERLESVDFDALEAEPPGRKPIRSRCRCCRTCRRRRGSDCCLISECSARTSSTLVHIIYLAEPVSIPSHSLLPSNHCCLCSSVAVVQFGPVQHPIFPNLRLDLGFGSAKLLNLGLDLRFRFGGGSDGFEPIFVSHGLITRKQ